MDVCTLVLGAGGRYFALAARVLFQTARWLPLTLASFHSGETERLAVVVPSVECPPLRVSLHVVVSMLGLYVLCSVCMCGCRMYVHVLHVCACFYVLLSVCLLV